MSECKYCGSPVNILESQKNCEHKYVSNVITDKIHNNLSIDSGFTKKIVCDEIQHIIIFCEKCGMILPQNKSEEEPRNSKKRLFG